LVTETEFTNANPNDFFTSEKTFKPILGMRPFFIYGQAPLRQYLKDQGFDIFEDIFDYSRITETANKFELMSQYSQVAIDAIKSCTTPGQDNKWFFHRTQANKSRFMHYAHEQWDKLHKLDLTQYVHVA
jgi:hypothetical protein